MKITKTILNIAIPAFFSFIVASHSCAMGDFPDDEKAPPPPTSMDQIKKQKEANKTAFKRGIINSVSGMRAYTNLEKASQFDSNFTASQAMFASAELLSLSNSNVVSQKIANDMYWYARYNIETLMFQSGMGVYLGYSKLMDKESMDKRINNIIKKTGAEANAQIGIYPIFLEFISGSPFYIKEPDANDIKTLRWNKSSFSQELIPASLGLSLAAKSKLSEILFNSHRGDLLGANPQDGFIGGMLTLSAISELDALLNMLAYDGERLGKADGKIYNPETGLKYFPRRINVKLEKEGDPQKPLEYSVIDDGSNLFDQAALIFGVSEFYHYSDPSVKNGWNKVFAEEKSGALFSLEYHKMAKDLLQILFKNIIFMHFDRDNNAFVSYYDKGKRGNNIFTDDFCMTIIGLSNLYRVLPDSDKLKGEVKKYIALQADFAKDKLQDKDGVFAGGYNVVQNRAIPAKRISLANQVSGMRGFIEAYKVTGDKTYMETAKKTVGVIEKRLWDKGKNIYLSSEGTMVSVYTPYIMAALFSGLVELAQEGSKEAIDRITFAYRMMKALQLSELSQTGETFFTGEEIDKMVETEGDRLFELTDDERGKETDAFLQKIADTDMDWVVKPLYASGGRGSFGGAPVFINQATILDYYGYGQTEAEKSVKEEKVGK